MTRIQMLTCQVLATLLLGLPSASDAQTVIKLATLVPEGSVWDNILREMSAEVERETEGRVRFQIFAGGVAGDEPDVVRKMRVGQLHAGAFTATGLSELDPSFKVFQIPMFFDSYEELHHVTESMEPTLSRNLDEKGYVFLHWGHGGWVHLFAKQPVRTLEEVKRLRMFAWAGDEQMVRWWRRNGFQPVALAYTDIMMGLQTGMIEALPTTPLAALSLQWFRATPYMPDLGLAPLVGGTVVSKRIWNRISEADRAKIRAAAKRAEEKLEREIPAQDERAIAAMKERGLTVIEIEGTEAEASWRQAADGFLDSMRALLVADAVFDQARRARDAFRRQEAASR